MRPRSGKCLFSPLQAFVFSNTIHLFWPGFEDTSGRIWQTECDVGKTRSIFIQAPPPTLVVVGSRRLETIYIVLLPFNTWSHAAFKRQPHFLWGGTAPTLSTLSSLFNGKLTLRLYFHFLSTCWPIQIPCDSKHSRYPLRISTNLPPEAQQHSERKAHELQMARSNLLLKSFKDCQGKLCPQ